MSGGQQVYLAPYTMFLADHMQSLTEHCAKEFGKTYECISFKAADFDGSLVSAQQAQAVADLPTKEVLQAQLLGIMLAPAQNLLSLLNQSVAQFVGVIKADQDKLEEQ